MKFLPMSLHSLSILNQESIHIGNNITSFIASEAVSNVPASCYVIITDQNVEIHLAALKQAFLHMLKDKNVKILTFVIPPGEINKTRDTKAAIEDWMLVNKCTRDTCLVALGGGVIGDLVGFSFSFRFCSGYFYAWDSHYSSPHDIVGHGGFVYWRKDGY